MLNLISTPKKFLQHLAVETCTNKELLTGLMGPSFPNDVRVWACIAFHAIGHGKLYAIRVVGNRSKLLGTQDIADLCGFSDRQTARRSIRFLESQGLVRREGMKDSGGNEVLYRDHVRLYAYAHPLPVRMRTVRDSQAGSIKPIKANVPAASVAQDGPIAVGDLVQLKPSTCHASRTVERVFIPGTSCWVS